ncbi:uncharacterized protein [Rutidosis leptorrhynchoides]|uniref:uncharacterized protein n=1 Tax=Rutidosis leptorrhynchoides TaxID=125765 RepID=UPI003A98E845
MGFDNKTRKWIRACLESASVSVLVNGSPTHEFKLERGIRQGDPLSPFLFIVAAEGLNILTKKGIHCGLFKGVDIGSHKVLLSHLQYANDTIFFGEWSRLNFCYLVKLLNCFEKMSGLKINYNKSSLYGLGVIRDEVERLALRIGSKIGPCRPLGKGGVWLNIVRAGCLIDRTGLHFGTPFIKQIGDENLTSFWDEPWLIEGPLKNRFKRLFHLDSVQTATVRDRIIWSENRWLCIWNWNRKITGRAHDEFQSLINLINSYVKQDMNFDVWYWKLATNDIFTTKKLSRLIDDETFMDNRRSRPETLKNNLVTGKVEVFIWKVINRRIPTRIELDNRDIAFTFEVL